MDKLENRHQTNQFIAAIVAEDNLYKAEQLAGELSKQDQAFFAAIQEVDKVRDFLATPENILGNTSTKHGEIAEQVEVGIRNAKSLLNSSTPRATFEGVGRTAPEDYLINGVQVQSKFINGTGNTLDHIIEHMKKYENFGRDGSFFHIPKDQYEKSYSDQKLQEKVQEIEQMSGHPFSQTVRPGLSNYSDVQIGKVDDTLARHEKELKGDNAEIKDRIRTEAQPNIADFGRVAVKGAVIGGSIRFATKIYGKYKEGKNVFKGELTLEDWKEIGIDTATGATLSSISATAIYGLTNFAEMSAPLAGAFVSAGMEVASLVKSWNRGEISSEEFVELSLFACADSAIVATGAAIGQALIPIPVIGAVIGSIAGRIVSDFCKILLGENTKLCKQVEQHYQKLLAQIDQDYKTTVANIIATYEKLGNLAQAAFNPSLNVELRLQASIKLAVAYNVPDSNIIHNVDELDLFMFS
ncbi:hypothetical protein [Nostoc sp. 'Peltigera malacea cyanobiont' DB3992]|uniref:hypothetical protein n=1 Tax=Nostoc sp. 'Peltigera malacea cyanobiont' DB3992 TaxID=1206980 RepID=UPI000C054E62|nr:hypothetical protein [Nostoc sp. 'Peltigera malacea cyanobiont' DB3992]PHM11264.1 hypothetical protein CK516_03515 [Nostoc sp. 'Peltigera malacea cyanobiont' DB3992]